MKQPAVNAPELETREGWVNTDRPYTLQTLRGKIVLLDFWTYGCINCQHIIPDLQRLEEEFAEELVVIGVHSGKFKAEQENRKIQEAILKFGVRHPVINDADYKLWDAYAIRAWPTTVLISPEGKVIGQHAGEGIYKVAKPYITQLLKEYEKRIRREKFPFQHPLPSVAGSTLRFPSKLQAGAGEKSIWCSDSGHNRILQLSPEGKVLSVIGSGEQGFQDGSFAQCTFSEPQGMALQGELLYIADTKNNSLRVADLNNKTVSTLAGTGALDYYFFEDRRDEPVLPNSPWDLLIYQDNLYIASAGNHQILQMNLQERVVKRFAGTGREALADGSLREAAFNQPSGLARLGNTLFVADAEASAVRAIDLQEGLVYTLLGKGLFDFGDAEGHVEDALLQHNMGIGTHHNVIYIADTYNGKIKALDLHKERVKTILAGLNEPNDLLFIQDQLWVSDTHNHQLIRVNLSTLQKQVVQVQF
jgi:thiol-disulfide isomerase/thioredoxin